MKKIRPIRVSESQPRSSPDAEVLRMARRRHVPEQAIENAVEDETANRPGEQTHHEEAAPARPRRRGHARKDERGKWQPTGDYTVGFGKPPVHTRFDGRRPGPGRPKGALSQDTYIKKELEEVRTIVVNGVPKKFKQRELAAKLLVKNAIEKQDHRHLLGVVELARQHFPEARSDETDNSPFADSGFDQAILRQLFTGLQLGELDPDAGDPLAQALRKPAANDQGDKDWGEEEWNAPAMEEEEQEQEDDNA